MIFVFGFFLERPLLEGSILLLSPDLLRSSCSRKALHSLSSRELPLFSFGLDTLFSGSLASSFLFYYIIFVEHIL